MEFDSTELRGVWSVRGRLLSPSFFFFPFGGAHRGLRCRHSSMRWSRLHTAWYGENTEQRAMIGDPRDLGKVWADKFHPSMANPTLPAGRMMHQSSPATPRLTTQVNHLDCQGWRLPETCHDPLYLIWRSLMP